jgi:hypothetical protein
MKKKISAFLVAGAMILTMAAAVSAEERAGRYVTLECFLGCGTTLEWFLPADEELTIWGCGTCSTPPPDETTSEIPSAFPTWSGSGSAAVRIARGFTDFSGLYLDGSAVDAANYTAAAGSTIITLNEAYLRTLGNGTHAFEARFGYSGAVNIPLTVNVADENEETGVTMVTFPILLAGAAIAAARKRK